MCAPQARALDRRNGNLRILCSILAVCRSALFWTSDAVPYTSHFISWHSSNSSILHYQSLSMYALFQLSTSHQYALLPQHPTQTLLSWTTPELLCPQLILHHGAHTAQFKLKWAPPVKLPFVSAGLGWTFCMSRFDTQSDSANTCPLLSL